MVKFLRTAGHPKGKLLISSKDSTKIVSARPAHSRCGQCWLKIHNTARYSLNSNRRSTRTDTLIQTAKKVSSHVFFVNLTTYKNRIKISKLDQKISFSEIFAVINSFSVVLFLSFSRVRTGRPDKLNSNRPIVFQKKMFDKLLIFK